MISVVLDFRNLSNVMFRRDCYGLDTSSKGFLEILKKFHGGFIGFSRVFKKGPMGFSRVEEELSANFAIYDDFLFFNGIYKKKSEDFKRFPENFIGV